ncbi:hypothetical protein SYJ56_06360 [Algoriphagus sp. D3-2-R+10]|uniref:hypothetical protein n=1 Tax=Algoriphagus aurantiacus TaxID=3103948 RepID=UPI002B36968B|nr:hypothetical protein [Algoriphagus sp. D3-2-R+10]MEB2774920.1 hypothetical protein [Algoriphagus sp. D3-2-R+10]
MKKALHKISAMNIEQKKIELIHWITELENEELLQSIDELKSKTLSKEDEVLLKILKMSNESKTLIPHTSVRELLNRK